MFQLRISPVNGETCVLFFNEAPNAKKIVRALNKTVDNLKKCEPESTEMAAAIAAEIYDLTQLAKVAAYYAGDEFITAAGAVIGEARVTEHTVF